MMSADCSRPIGRPPVSATTPLAVSAETGIPVSAETASGVVADTGGRPIGREQSALIILFLVFGHARHPHYCRPRGIIRVAIPDTRAGERPALADEHARSRQRRGAVLALPGRLMDRAVCAAAVREEVRFWGRPLA